MKKDDLRAVRRQIQESLIREESVDSYDEEIDKRLKDRDSSVEGMKDPDEYINELN